MRDKDGSGACMRCNVDYPWRMGLLECACKLALLEQFKIESCNPGSLCALCAADTHLRGPDACPRSRAARMPLASRHCSWWSVIYPRRRVVCSQEGLIPLAHAHE